MYEDAHKLSHLMRSVINLKQIKKTMNEIDIIRKKLKEVLLQRGINQSNLSDISRVSQPTINRFLKGSAEIKLTNLLSLLNSLNLSISDLLTLNVTTSEAFKVAELWDSLPSKEKRDLLGYLRITKSLKAIEEIDNKVTSIDSKD